MLLNSTHQTEEGLFSCYNPSVVVYRYFAVVWGCVIIITGTAGNLMTILAFISDARLRTRFNLLIINLAVADLLHCTVLQPFSVDTYLHLRWRSGPLWCKTFALLVLLFNSVSILTLCLLAAGRYLMVAKRAVFDLVFSNRGIFFLLTSVWVLALTTFGLLWDVLEFVPLVCKCSVHHTKYRHYTTALLWLYALVGPGSVGVFYFLIYRHVKTVSQAMLRYRQDKKKPASTNGTDANSVESSKVNTCDLRSHVEQAQISCGNFSQSNQGVSKSRNSSTTNNPDVVSSTVTSAASSSHSAAPGDTSDFTRVTCMCFTVILCFMLCFLPYILLNIVDKHNRAPRVVYIFCVNLTWLNSCINPVLYAVMNRHFQQAYRVLLTKAAMPFTCWWSR